MTDSTSRTIVITGATRGLGKALVTALTKRGHVLAGCGTSPEQVESLQQSPGPAEHFSAVNITDRKVVNAWASSLIKRIGPPDMLINNAGILEEGVDFIHLPADEFDRVIDVNVKGTANVLRAFLPPMIKAKKGIIVNMTSGAGVMGFPQMSAYCASKFAIEGLTKAIAREIPPSMACIPLQPGVINTDMLKSHYGERAKDHPTAEEWADGAASFILNLSLTDSGESLRVPQE